MKVYKNGDVIEPHPTALKHYLDSGWSLIDPEKKTAKKVSKKKVEEVPKTKLVNNED